MKKALYIRNIKTGEEWMVTKMNVRIIEHGSDTDFGKTTISAYIPEQRTVWKTKDFYSIPNMELVLK